MAKKAVIWIVVIAVVFIAVIFLINQGEDVASDRGAVAPVPRNNADNSPISGGADNSGSASANPIGPQTHTIEMTATGFSPSEITINQGDSVNFVNSGMARWPASDVHPTHTVYPGSSIGKCGTSEQNQIFDACRPIDSYSFTFNSAGNWRYHDHLNPSKGGSITVVG